MISFDAVFPSLSLNHKLQASLLGFNRKFLKRQFVFAEILSFLGVFMDYFDFFWHKAVFNEII
jgi:hypothetical protein